MTEIMAITTEFFFAHSVAICITLGVLFVLSSILFLKTLNKNRKNKRVESKNSNTPEIDELEKMYLDSLKN